MADGSFPTLVSKDRDANLAGNPIFVQLTDGTTVLDTSGGGLEVTVSNATLAVTQSGTWNIGSVASITADVNIADGGNSITVDGAVTVSATDLDIRNLSETTDQVLIFANTAKDGTGTDYVPLVDADGKLVISNPGGTEYTEDVASPATITGTATMMERDDALSAVTPIEGDWLGLRGSAEGALWVQDFNSDGILADTNAMVVDLAAMEVDLAAIEVLLTGIDSDTNTIQSDTTGILADTAALVIDAAAIEVLLTGIDVDTDAIKTAVELLDNAVDGNYLNVNMNIAGVDVSASAPVPISATAAANTETNPIFVKAVDEVISGNEICDYDTAAGVASDGVDNHDYTVAGTTFMLKRVIFSASGGGKAEIQTGPVASLTTKAVVFVPHRGGTERVVFDPPVEVPVTSTGTVRVIRTNRAGSGQDVYSTIEGYDI